ncbi:unnamed protein product [Ilex paraguariensis]|uniref:Uncharacterized protein n=1 Tax=Ilex paraguariensis TaxID=185542 RepID=A0ABC8RUF9_9AQUA
MAGLGKQGAARRGGGQLSVLLPVSLPYDKQTQIGANGGTLPLARESHGSTSVNNAPLPEGHVEHNVESSSTRRKRGPTRNIALAKKKQAGEKLNVEMPEELGRIVGLECQPLITELGCIVRKHAPLQVTKWAKIDKADRESLLQMAKTAQTGEVLGPIELYRITHYSNKKRSWVNDRENEAPACEEEICSEVLGHKSGYICGRGHGPKPNRSLSKHHDKSKLEAANKRANELEEKLNAQQKDMEVIKATQKATNEILQALMEQMQAATQKCNK